MSLPTSTVLTHNDWKKKRDAAGGKAGLSKIDMGKKLDEFAAFLKTGDIKKADAATSALETAAKAYAAEVSKKHPKVAAVVTADILGKLKTFEAGVKTEVARIDAFRAKFKKDLMTVITDTKKFVAAFDKLEGELDALIAKYKDGVPPEQAATLAKVADAYEKNVEKLRKESWKVEELAKPLAHYDQTVQAAYAESLDVAVDLLEQRRQKLRWCDKLATQLTQLSKTVKKTA